MAKTIFQKIIDQEVDATVRFEDDHFIVIDDIHPKAPIHLLIIPKQPYPTLEAVDFNNEEFYSSLLKLARTMAQKMKIADNYKLVLNVGDKIQDVPHLHLHLLGGWHQKNIEEQLNEANTV